MSARRELVALQASGIPVKKILRPFLGLAFLCALFNLISTEFLLPSSLNYLDLFRQQHFKHTDRGDRKEHIHVIYLKDRSKLVYQTEDKEKQLYFDVFWVRSADEMWRMKYLNPRSEQPIGYFVDHLVRSPEGNFKKTESYEKYQFPSFNWQNKQSYTPVENRKLSELYRQITHKKLRTAFEYPQILSFFLHKCAMPFLSLLVVFAAAPLCLRYSRSVPVFLTYALALFTYVAFCALVDAALILGETQIISPYLAILLPFGLSFLGFGWKFAKL